MTARTNQGFSMLRLLAIAALLFLAPLAAPEPAEAGACFSMAPMCGLGLHPVCVCFDAMGSNCQWMCVR